MFKKKIMKGVLFVVIFIVIVTLTACDNSEENGPKKVVKQYFDALKMGDVDGAISCFTPTVQEKLKVSKIFSVGWGDSLKETYKDCSFKIDKVTFTDEEHEHADVHVTVSGGKGNMPSEDTLETVKYNEEWYLDSKY